MRHIDSPQAARELGTEVLSPRRRPLVLISTDESGAFLYDPQHVESEVGQHVDVVTIATAEATYALEAVLPAKTSLYGGAARAYPPDFHSAPDWWRSSLRFPKYHGVEELIEDALAQVVTTVIAPVERARWVSATVELVSGTTGNIARLEDGERVMIVADRLSSLASLAEGLEVGGHVDGWLLGKDLAPEAEQFTPSRFLDGSSTLARVVKVTDRRVNLLLHPLAPEFVLRRRDVIPGVDEGENDDVSCADIVREGETVRVRVTRNGQALALSLIHVDPNATLVEPLPLLKGGVPWLREGVHQQVAAPKPLLDPSTAAPPPSEATVVPAFLPPRTAGASAGTRDLQDIRDELAGLRSAIGRLGHELREGTDLETLDRLRDEVTTLTAQLREEREKSGERALMIGRLTRDLREAKAARPEVAHDPDSPSQRRGLWPDPESWIRNEIRIAWTHRVLAGEKSRYPLQDGYLVGSDFVSSLQILDDGQLDKMLRAAVHVLTGRAPEVPSLELHELRTGLGGEDAPVTRADGAKCWRVAIEQKTASARSLHYWVLPGRRIELSRVVIHDDYTP
ncbi:hypothetical protein [Rathayibacter sp. AY1D2]|uniref:hypothetical protein n=1 Tax=Rathayibacter sp. AY1D2 TaxID=2080543 RepID=UPI0011B05B8C|nr:hypothetical protein [Rathayibacter sp. AY1D2]